jgi:two-component system LytT family sensor kinase
LYFQTPTQLGDQLNQRISAVAVVLVSTIGDAMLCRESARQNGGMMNNGAHPRWRPSLTVLTIGAWTFVAAVFVAQNVVSALGRAKRIDWQHDVLNECLYWIAYAALTPVLVWMARQYSLITPPRSRAIRAHVLASCAIAVCQVVMYFALLGLTGVLLGTIGTIGTIGTTSASAWLIRQRSFAFVLTITAFWKYWVIIALVHGVEYARLYDQERRDASALREQLTAAKLDQLKARLQPHFLFNTLNGIAVLLRDDPERARTMLVRLSEMLRAVIDAGDEQFVSLRQEMSLVQRYLEIQQMRLAERLQTMVDIPHDAAERRVPHFLIQPLVENAVQHGIARAELGGTVSIRARSSATHLDIEIRDMPRGAVDAKGHSAGSGIGLAATRERLERLYGEGYRLEMHTVADGGTLVALRLPFEPVTERI